MFLTNIKNQSKDIEKCLNITYMKQICPNIVILHNLTVYEYIFILIRSLIFQLLLLKIREFESNFKDLLKSLDYEIKIKEN